MVQILKFPERSVRQQSAEKYARLIESFSSARRIREDVFWLKENAELLNIFECTGLCAATAIRPEAVSSLAEFYSEAERLLCFFRQYYRFTLSICMDLEDLGLVDRANSNRAEVLAQWVQTQGLPAQELSDLQRAEARRLLARRDVACEFPGLDERLHGFISAGSNFAIPNKKAAYELTHIVFYLSDYGKCDPGLSHRALQSLAHVGVLAFLDRDADLLAEICIAQRYAGQVPAAAWETWLAAHNKCFTVLEEAPLGGQDDYHMFLVGNWHQAVCGGPVFLQWLPEGAMTIKRPVQSGILQTLSQVLFRAGKLGGDWQNLRAQVEDALTEDQHSLLLEAEGSCPDFGTFFEGFSRVGTVRRE